MNGVRKYLTCLLQSIALLICFNTTTFAEGCNRYLARIRNNSAITWELTKTTVVHGRILKATDVIKPGDTGEVLTDSIRYLLWDILNEDYRGPDVTVTYADAHNNKRFFTLRLQQDFCLPIFAPPPVAMHSEVIAGGQYIQHLSDTPSETFQDGGRSDFNVTFFN